MICSLQNYHKVQLTFVKQFKQKLNIVPSMQVGFMWAIA